MALADPFVNIPSVSDPINFNTEAENFFNVQFPLKVSEISAAALAMSLNSTNATSTSSVLIGTGSKSFTTQAGKSYLGGMFIIVADAAAPSTNYIYGQVTSYSGTALVINGISVGGSGTLANWVISQAAPGGATNTFVQQTIQNQSANYVLATGTATAVTATPATAYGTVAAGQEINLTLPNAATGIAMTLQLAGQAALTVKTNTGTDPIYPANYKGIFELNTAATQWILKNPLQLGVQIQPITASVASNAMTLTLNPTSLEFRSATLGSGATTMVSIPAAISTVISSGSTGGTVSAVASRIVVIAINNAGTIELAWCNISGGIDLSETGLISTTAEGGAGAADSATVVYSTTARTSVAYRVVGYVDSTQATAGTWATAPSTIQGAGGQASSSMASLGYGQTWQDVAGSRAIGTTYYNTTGKPIGVAVRVTIATAGNTVTATVNGVLAAFSSAVANTSNSALSVIVPVGHSYSIAVTGGSSLTWSELR
jgi:hypothetical protein